MPTTVTVGPDGAIYVGELKGFPFRPGSSNVWRIEADADGAWCSVNTPDDDCTVYKSDLTAIQDIAFNNANNRLYVLQLARDGVLAFEEGLETGVFPPGDAARVQSHRALERAGARARHGPDLRARRRGDRPRRQDLRHRQRVHRRTAAAGHPLGRRDGRPAVHRRATGRD